MSRNDRSPDEGGRSDGFEEVGRRKETPDFRAARKHLLTELVRFVGILRNDGVAVPASGTLSAARALATVGLDDEDRVSAALRASLLSETGDSAPFEEAFPTFWRRLRGGFDRIATTSEGPKATGDETENASGSAGESDSEAGTLPEAEAPETTDGGDGEVSVRIPTDRRHASGDRPASSGDSNSRRYSAVGEREPVDAAISTPQRGGLAAIDRFVDAVSTLPGRRHRRSETGPTVDARAALRESLETGGAPLELPYTAPARSELRCCLLIDVSGSVLDTVDRGALLSLAERLTSRALGVRVFLFDTEFLEATEAFTRSEGDPAGALRGAEIEWGGGTKIGKAFEELRRIAPHAVDRRTAVVVVSDGLDVGEPELLADGITWLADRAHSVVWLNPLAVSPAFEPESRGMSIVAPYIDALFGFAEPADLAEAAGQIERRGLSGQVGYQHDSRRISAAADGGWRR
jgi:hypothetical protein